MTISLSVVFVSLLFSMNNPFYFLFGTSLLSMPSAFPLPQSSVSNCLILSPPGLPSQLSSKEAANSAGDLWSRSKWLHWPGVCSTPAHVCKYNSVHRDDFQAEKMPINSTNDFVKRFYHTRENPDNLQDSGLTGDSPNTDLVHFTEFHFSSCKRLQAVIPLPSLQGHSDSHDIMLLLLSLKLSVSYARSATI